MIPAEKLDFVHFPIVDCNVGDDDQILNLCKDLVLRIKRGENLYIHCCTSHKVPHNFVRGNLCVIFLAGGGHGRTGTVISIMLHLMYNLGARESMEYCQFVHDIRMCPIDVGSPQTQQQRLQVTDEKNIAADSPFIAG